MATDLLFSRVGPELWFARREDERIVELRLGEEDPFVRAGNLLRLRVSRVVPGIQSAFLTTPQEPNAYLSGSDPSNATQLPIESRLKEGDSLIVRVEREGIDSKGPRVSEQVSLPGRRLVYFPGAPLRRISRRIKDVAERQRLEGILAGLEAEGGFVVRTAAEGAPAEALVREGQILIEQWKQVLRDEYERPSPTVLHRELGLGLRILRDLPLGAADSIQFDCVEDCDDARRLLQDFEPELVPLVQLHEGPQSLFEDAGMDGALDQLMKRKIWLRSGGFLIVEEGEALVAIDVNTGRNLGKRSLEQTVLQTNREAARAIAALLRLRDLGGIVVIDFIDMDQDSSRAAVLEELRTHLQRDATRTTLGRFSALGLLELTRKRNRLNLSRLLTSEYASRDIVGRCANARWIAHRIHLETLQRRREARYTDELGCHPDVIAEIERRSEAEANSTVPRDSLRLRSEPSWSRSRYEWKENEREP